MDPVIPNLDGLSDTDLGIYEKAFDTLASYAYYIRAARAQRLAGRVDLALANEERAEHTYDRLPPEFCW